MLCLGLALLLPGLWALSQLVATSTPTSPPRGQATLPLNASATSSAVSSTPAASVPRSLQQVTAHFLAAYFTWSAGDNDAAYTSRWRPFVADGAARDLLQAAPHLTLDGGNDGAASSPVPVIPASAVAGDSQQAQVQVTWAIQVLPPGGELVQWQPRRIQARVDLLQGASGWLIALVTWSSTSG